MMVIMINYYDYIKCVRVFRILFVGLLIGCFTHTHTGSQADLFVGVQSWASRFNRM